jgi:hypothetical protein
MASDKELHFFDNETLDWRSPDYELLHRFFDGSANGILRGEATPIYTYWPNAIERLAAYNPAAKLIIGLRHPTHRAFSHWRMETTRNDETLPFSDAIRVGRDRVREAPGGVHRVFSYVERGFYARQIKRLLRCFPRNQLHFFRTDRLWSDPAATLADAYSFLSVARAPVKSAPDYIVPLQSADLGELEAADRAALLDLFEADIRETGELTAIPLQDWLTLDYREPMPTTLPCDDLAANSRDAPPSRG